MTVSLETYPLYSLEWQAVIFLRHRGPSLLSEVKLQVHNVLIVIISYQFRTRSWSVLFV